MHAIHKFPLTDAPQQLVRMPRNAKIIALQLQRGILTLWAMVETKNPMAYRGIEVRVTGDYPLGNMHGDYLGTLQFEGGDFILHYFDRGQKADEGEALGAILHPWFVGE